MAKYQSISITIEAVQWVGDVDSFRKEVINMLGYKEIALMPCDKDKGVFMACDLFVGKIAIESYLLKLNDTALYVMDAKKFKEQYEAA